MREFINPHTVVVTIIWEEIKACSPNLNFFSNVKSLLRKRKRDENNFGVKKMGLQKKWG